MNKIILYSTPTCVQCKQVVKLLDRLEKEYEYIDVTNDSSAMAHIKELGYSSVPVLEQGETLIHGFNPIEIRKLN